MGRRAVLLACMACAVMAGCLPPTLGSRIILRPNRELAPQPRLPHEDLTLGRGSIHLRGWLFRPEGPPRGLVVYLHGRNGSRALGTRVAESLVPEGFAVLAYDQRGHGRSGGMAFTYGYYEKYDLIAWLDALGIQPVYLVGHSTGAAVALQAAALDSRIRGVVSIASFARLEDVIRRHAPSFAGEPGLQRVLASAEHEARFRVDAVAPEDAARSIDAPVLLVHGLQDTVVPPDHALRIWRRIPDHTQSSLVLVRDAGHADLLGRQSTWERVRSWVLTREQPVPALSTRRESRGRAGWAGGGTPPAAAAGPSPGCPRRTCTRRRSARWSR
jgi:uncharacterized protein